MKISRVRGKQKPWRSARLRNNFNRSRPPEQTTLTAAQPRFFPCASLCMWSCHLHLQQTCRRRLHCIDCSSEVEVLQQWHLNCRRQYWCGMEAHLLGLGLRLSILHRSSSMYCCHASMPRDWVGIPAARCPCAPCSCSRSTCGNWLSLHSLQWQWLDRQRSAARPFRAFSHLTQRT